MAIDEMSALKRAGLLLLVFGVTWEAMAWVYRKEHKIKLRSLAEAVRYVNS